MLVARILQDVSGRRPRGGHWFRMKRDALEEAETKVNENAAPGELDQDD